MTMKCLLSESLNLMLDCSRKSQFTFVSKYLPDRIH
ncbi:hypothetical protein Tsp_11715, partial [Trichinella spiralis]